MNKTIYIAEAQVNRLAEADFEYSSEVPEFAGPGIRTSEPITGKDGEVVLNAGPDTDKFINMTCPDGFYGSRITRMV